MLTKRLTLTVTVITQTIMFEDQYLTLLFLKGYAVFSCAACKSAANQKCDSASLLSIFMN